MIQLSRSGLPMNTEWLVIFIIIIEERNLEYMKGLL